MRFRDKFRLFAVLRVAAGRLLPALVLAFLFGGAAVSPPVAASAMASVSPGMHEQAVLGEDPLPRGAAAPVPDRQAPCFDRHHPCGQGEIASANAEPLSFSLARQARYVAPRAREQVRVPDVAPHHTASLSILFRNFRE